MGLEAVEYVKQAEEKLEELRRNSQNEAKKSYLKLNKKLNKIK